MTAFAFVRRRLIKIDIAAHTYAPVATQPNNGAVIYKSIPLKTELIYREAQKNFWRSIEFFHSNI